MGSMNLLSTVCHRLAKTRHALGILSLLAMLTPRLVAASYFVDYEGGADANTGTSMAFSWKHCPGDPAASGTAATAILAAGDTVFFKGGVTYIFTGASGIVLRWNGLKGSPITYDGNSAGTWGSGRSRFTDNYSGNSNTAFASSGDASYLAFKNLEIGAMGGAATLPIDLGSSAAAKFGGGIAFNGSVTGTAIDSCVFHDLGYTFSQRPMSVDSIAGNGVSFKNCNDLSLTNSTFSRMAVGIQMEGATSLSMLTIKNCTFSDAMVWSINLPPSVSLYNGSVSGCVELINSQFDRLVWSGYGPSPRSTNQAATEGSTVTLVASAIATPNASFQWLKNGTTISGATNSRISFSAVATTDAGIYTAVATNASGVTVSNDAVLTVTASTSTPPPPTSSSAPVISSQPVNVAVAPLSTAVFSVVASGSPVPTYQWQKNGVSISGWTNATLALEGVSSNDVGNYNVVVANTAGSVTSNIATLSVGAPSADLAPSITTQPVGLTIDVLANATFSVVATGSPEPSFQWLKGGVPLSGRISSTLLLTGVGLSDAGSYSVKVSNSAGSVTSNSAPLVVMEPQPVLIAPLFTTQPISQTVAALSSVTFSSAASGTPVPTYQWTRNGVAVSGWTNATLTLAGVSANDGGTYAVIATNSAGSAVSNGATLTVVTVQSTESAPSFSLQPVSQAVAPFATATFSAAASGNPTPTYQWTRNGVAFSGWTGATLTLEGVSSNDIGIYAVTATNSVGSVTSNGVSLSLSSTQSSTTAPTFTLQPVSQTVTRKSKVTFSAAAAGTPAPTYQWMRNGVTFAGWTGPTLTLDGVSTNDVGTYVVVATNSAGSVTSTGATLTVTNTKAAVVGSADGLEALLPDTTSRLVNLSVRSNAGTGSDSLIVGFVVSGDADKTVLIRGSGPALADFGVQGAMSDPALSLYAGASLIAANDNWGSSASANAVAPTSLRFGAFAFSDQSRDSALVATLGSGAYSARVSSNTDSDGVALVELYDTAPASASRLVNISVRTTVSDTNTPIIGFVVEGMEPKKLLVRAVGPGLAAFGVDQHQTDPRLEIFKGAESVQQSDNWSGSAELAAAFERVGAFPLDPSSKDAAAIVTAAPGAYTMAVGSANNTSGTVIVEVYELP